MSNLDGNNKRGGKPDNNKREGKPDDMNNSGSEQVGKTGSNSETSISSDSLKNQIVLGNCISIMQNLPGDSFAACITDPPYNYEFIGKQWNSKEITRRKNRVTGETSTLVKNIPYGGRLSGGVRNKAWYERNRQNIKEYCEWVTQWGAGLFKILMPGAFCLVFSSTRTAAHVQVSLEEAGFFTRDILVWRRNTGFPRGLNFSRFLAKRGDKRAADWEGWHSTLRCEFETIVVAQKPLKQNYLTNIEQYGVGLLHAENSNGGFKTNIIEGLTKEKTDRFNHPTVKPLQLIEYLVDLVVPRDENNIVIDPFLGSGTTAVACKNLGLSYYGIEIEKDYFPLIHSRLGL